MSDLISRADAIDALNKEYHGMLSDESMKIYQIKNWLQSLPSAEQKTGEWIEEDEYSDLWVCDQCGFASEYRDNYCPNCGARMRGEKNDKR